MVFALSVQKETKAIKWFGQKHALEIRQNFLPLIFREFLSECDQIRRKG